jgi:hypothetical protein
MTYQVRVLGTWDDEPHESAFLITSCFALGAEIAGVQLFAQQASLQHAPVGTCEATASQL